MISLQLTEEDFQRCATTLDVEVATVKAVQEVETGGRGGFFEIDKPAILFEGHILPLAKLLPLTAKVQTSLTFVRLLAIFGTNSRSEARTPKSTPPTTRIYYIPSGVRSITKVE